MPAPRKSQSNESTEIVVPTIERGFVEVGIVGQEPFICNRMSEKAKQELLMPKGRKNAAERATTLKHEPLEEFRASPYTSDDPQAPTLLLTMASGFKKAIMTAALRTPGSTKTEIGQLVWVHGMYVPLWGTPQMLMAVTRSADASKTPDVRTRAVLPQWATVLQIGYVKPYVTETTIVNLLNMAGVCSGVGDWRPEKGAGSFGQFRLADAKDPEFTALKKQGRAVQLKAMDNPEPYDVETAELFEWFGVEVVARGRRAKLA